MNTDVGFRSGLIWAHLWFHFLGNRAATDAMEYISSADQKTLNARYQNTALVGVALGRERGALPGHRTIDFASGDGDRCGAGQDFLLCAVFSGARDELGSDLLRRWQMARLAGKTSVNAILGALGTASIIGAALGEVVSILGLVGFMVTGDQGYSWRLGGLGLALIMYSFPRRGEWARAVSNAAKTSDE